MRYYTYDETSKSLIPASKVISMEDGSRVTGPILAEQYAAVGAYPLGTPAPIEVTEGKIAVPDGYVLDKQAGCWRRKHRLEDVPPPPPRTFVTADLVEALMAEGIWEDVRAWIESKGLLDLVFTTKEFDETNANFQAGKAALQAELGWTDAEVEALLAPLAQEV